MLALLALQFGMMKPLCPLMWLKWLWCWNLCVVWHYCSRYPSSLFTDDTFNNFCPESMLFHTAEATDLHGHGFCALCLWQHGCKYSGPMKITWRANRSRRQSSPQLVWGSWWKLRGTARNSSYILARLHNKLARVALENAKTVAGGSQWVKEQQIVGASVVVMTLRVKLKFTLQTGGFCSEKLPAKC